MWSWCAPAITLQGMLRMAMAVALDRSAIRKNSGGDFYGTYADGTRERVEYLPVFTEVVDLPKSWTKKRRKRKRDR